MYLNNDFEKQLWADSVRHFQELFQGLSPKDAILYADDIVDAFQTRTKAEQKNYDSIHDLAKKIKKESKKEPELIKEVTELPKEVTQPSEVVYNDVTKPEEIVLPF